MTPVTTTGPAFRPYAGFMTKTTTQITTTERQSAPLRPVWLHVLSAGTWPGQNGDVTISPDDLQAIVDSYDPTVHEAPAVLGHPATDDPAYGWVRSVQVRDDGLWANTDLQPELAEMVQQQLYRKLSVALYPPGSVGNPVPNSFYFKHLGFLGGQAPAVKGLKPVSLAAGDDSIHIHFSQKETSVEDENTTVTLSEQQLAEKQQEITLAEADLTKRRKALRREELTARFTPHINAGRLLPSQRPLLVELAERIDGQAVEFAEGEKPTNLLDELDKFLGQLPQQVVLTEVAGADKKPPGQPAKPINFNAPAGTIVDAESAAFNETVIAYCKANPGSTYLEGVRAMKGNQ